MSNRDGNDATYVMNVDGSDQVQLSETTMICIGPVWKPINPTL